MGYRFIIYRYIYIYLFRINMNIFLNVYFNFFFFINIIIRFFKLKVNVHQIMDPDNQVLIEGEFHFKTNLFSTQFSSFSFFI